MRKWNKLLALLLAMVMALSLTVTGFAADAEDVEGEEEPVAAFEVPEDVEGAIVILHTNDVHGAIEGYAKVAALKAMYEEAGAYVLVVDAGDFSQGETSVSVSQGATAIELMNMVGYDAAAPGNHEFDYGYENLTKLAEAAEFHILAANITYEGELAFGDNFTFETEDGVKIGVFGLDTPEAKTKSHPGKTVGVEFASGEEMYAVAQAQVDALADCDYVICLGHLGIDEETAVNANRSIDLLEKVTGIDVFIDGHSHSTLEQIAAVTNEGRTVGKTVVTSTGTKVANIGVVTIKGDEITTENVAAETIPVAEDDAIAARAAEIRAEIEEEYGATFATTEVKLNGDRDPGNRTEETNLGDLITDAILWYATKDGEDMGVAAENVVALTNGGGIRATIEAGDISKNDVNTVLPFGNTVAYVSVTGEELLEALEASTFCTPTAIGGFPQVAGISFTIDVGQAYDQGDVYPGSEYHKPNSINRVTIDSINGQDFDPEASYAVVTNDFTAAGGDTYYAFSTATVVDTGTPLDEALMQYITEVLEGTVTAEQYAEPAGRITIVGEPPVEDETPDETPAEAVSFTDVTEANWHYEFVMKMVESGAVGGYADGTFLPGASVKWGEALAMVMRWAEYEEQSAVEGGTWASGWIAKALEDGLVEGEVEQNAVITRVELCELIAKAKDVAPSESASAFADTDNAYVQSLVELGVVDGMPDGTFQPDGELTRAQLCKILASFPETPADETPEEAPAYIETEITIDVPEQDKVPAHTITGILTVPTGVESAVPGVVMLHGTGSNLHEVNGAYDMAAAEMAENGLATLRFNFMGIGDGKEEEYVGYSYTSANVDAKAAADYLAGLDAVDGDALAVMGWSQGGTNALLAAAAYPETFKAVVTWAGALDLTGMTEDFAAAAAEAKENGFWTMEFDWRTALPFGAQWFEDVENTDVLEKVQEIAAPILAINGEGDTVVDPASGEAIVEASQNELSKNVMIPDCDHTLNMFSDSMDAIQAVIDATCEFFTANLTAESAQQAA